MAHRSFCWRPAHIAASLFVIALAPLSDHVDAQDNGNRPAAPTPAPNSKNFGTVSETDRLRKWISDLIVKHDKSGNKILEGDELKSLGQSAREADVNTDGKITHDELFQYYASKTKVASSGTSAPQPTVQTKIESKAPSKNLAKRKIAKSGRKSYRFKTAKERLQSWRFASKDANGDGQVSMSEYARSWTDRMAAEFERYDQDNDGMITAAETK
jgi:Ca2+-binding EF-hand superfamily protein